MNNLTYYIGVILWTNYNALENTASTKVLTTDDVDDDDDWPTELLDGMNFRSLIVSLVGCLSCSCRIWLRQ
jgi:hypothetical protein